MKKVFYTILLASAALGSSPTIHAALPAATPVSTEKVLQTAPAPVPFETPTATERNIRTKAPRDRVRGENDRSQAIALILALTLGPLGVHRFYLRRYLSGVIMFFTFGGGVLWWLIDIVRILTGGLKPRGGQYYDRF